MFPKGRNGSHPSFFSITNNQKVTHKNSRRFDDRVHIRALRLCYDTFAGHPPSGYLGKAAR
jgi:hypothetical protein